MHRACRGAKPKIPKAPAKRRWATQTGREASTGNIWLVKVLGSAKFFVPHRDATRPESRSPRDTRPHRVHSGRHTYATRNEARNRRLRDSFRTLQDRKSKRLNSRHRTISYAVFYLKK